MAMQMMKRSMSRMLKQSIVDLCRTSIGTDGYVEIDGIVCITIGEEETEEIVVKVHEILGDDDELPINIRRVNPQPPRNTPPANQRGGRMNQQASQNQSMANSLHGGKAIYTQSPGKQTQGHHGSSQGGHSRAHPQGDSYKRQTPTPTKSQPDKKTPPIIDDTVIKIEIESDEETAEPTSTKANKGRSAAALCSVCDLMVPSVAALKQHMTDVHRASVCEICWQPFTSKAELENHMKTHDKTASRMERAVPSPRNDGKGDRKDSGERFKCGVCGNTSDSRQVMVDHLKSGHEFQGCYTCMLCREYFPNKPTFTIHRKLSHPMATDIVCQNCGVGLKNSEYENHRKECLRDDTPTQKKNTKKQKDGEADSAPPSKRRCANAGPSSAAAAAAAAAATVVHNSGKSNKPGDKKHFECQICCLLLDSFSAYGTHIKNIHQRFVCPICAGTFQTNRAVQQHTTRHTNSLPFTCDKCGLGSHTEDEFKRHNVVSHNAQPGLFTCAQCDLLIGSKGEFLSHMAEVHKVDYLWDEELEKYVVLEVDGDEDGYDEEGEYMDEEGYVPNHGEYDNGARQHYADGNYDMEDEDEEQGYDDEGMDPTGGDMVTCNICELVMPSVNSLKDHISNVHHAVVCEVCWRPFLSEAELDAHRKVHMTDGTGGLSKSPAAGKEAGPKTPSKASPGPAAASSPAPRSGNIKIATSFKCGVCGSGSDGRRGMVDHLKSAHEYLGCFTCMLCGEFFPNKPTFTIHRKLSHSSANEMTCQSCGVGLLEHEFDHHVDECEGGGIDIKEAEWEGKKESAANVKQEKK